MKGAAGAETMKSNSARRGVSQVDTTKPCWRPTAVEHVKSLIGKRNWGLKLLLTLYKNHDQDDAKPGLDAMLYEVDN